MCVLLYSSEKNTCSGTTVIDSPNFNRVAVLSAHSIATIYSSAPIFQIFLIPTIFSATLVQKF